jgi:hypothetical protein
MASHCGLLLLALLTAVGLQPADSSRRVLTATGAVPAIVGGRNAQKNRFPYYTSLREAVSSYHFCGSTLIAPRFLLTAAHCITEWATPQAVEWSAPHRAFPRARVGAYQTYPVPAVPGVNSYEHRQVIAVAVHRLFDSGESLVVKVSECKRNDVNGRQGVGGYLAGGRGRAHLLDCCGAIPAESAVL